MDRKSVNLRIVPAKQELVSFDDDQFIVKLSFPGLDIRGAMLAAHFSGLYGWGDYDSGQYEGLSVGNYCPVGDWWWAESGKTGVNVHLSLESGEVQFLLGATKEGEEKLDGTTSATELSLDDRLRVADTIREFLGLDFGKWTFDEEKIEVRDREGVVVWSGQRYKRRV